MSTIEQTTATRVRPDRGQDSSWVRVLVWLSIVTAVVDLALPGLAGAVIPPLAVGAALTVAGLVVLRRSQRAGVVVLGVVSLLLVLTSAPFSAPALVHPESPLSFLHAVVHMGGRLLAVVAAVGARRGVAPPGGGAAPLAGRRLAVVAIGLLGLTVVTAGIATLLVPTVTTQPGDVTVTVQDVAFPDEVRVGSGDAVFVTNDDLVRHTFTVEDTDLSTELPERSNVRVGIDLPAGSYRLFCAVPGHEAMTATLVVE